MTAIDSLEMLTQTLKFQWACRNVALANFVGGGFVSFSSAPRCKESSGQPRFVRHCAPLAVDQIVPGFI